MSSVAGYTTTFIIEPLFDSKDSVEFNEKLLLFRLAVEAQNIPVFNKLLNDGKVEEGNHTWHSNRIKQRIYRRMQHGYKDAETSKFWL